MPETLKPKDARVPVASREVFVLDVRPTEDWTDAAPRIPGSVHIPADEIESRTDELPDDTKILVVCDDGERSSEVAESLGDGELEVVLLEGGVEAWRNESLMTQPSADAAPPKGEDEPPEEEPEDEDEVEDGEEDDGNGGAGTDEAAGESAGEPEDPGDER